MDLVLNESEQQVLQAIAEGKDPFAICHVRGDYGKCMLTLANLRRAGLIDHHDHLTDSGQGYLVGHAA